MKLRFVGLLPAAIVLSIMPCVANAQSVTGDNLAIGSTFKSNTPPTNGAIFQGNVGIGTSTPADILDVFGGTAASGNGTNIGLTAQNGHASGNTNGGNILLLPGAANGTGTPGGVGIGTINPAGNALLVYGGTIENRALAANDSTLLFSNNTNDERAMITGLDVGALTFTILNSERMRLTSSGYLGIGTTVPAAPLSFGTGFWGAPGNASVIRIYDTGNPSTSWGLGVSVSPSLFNIVSGGGLAFWTGSTNEPLYITSAGQVGIGTTSPQNLLDIGASGGIHITSGVPTNTSYALYNNGGTLYWNGSAVGSGGSTTPGGSNKQIQYNNNGAFGGASSFVWDSSTGNVGIGTASPSTLLHVDGAVTLGLAGTTAGTLAIANTNPSGTVTVQNPSATGTYNFNLPATPGSTGQPLLSGAGGSTAMSWGTLSGNTTKFVTTTGTLTSNDCAKFDANGNLVDAGAACGSGSGGTPGGSNQQIQYNNSGAFGGASTFVWNNSTGNVGIGTASPSGKLDINTGANTDVLFGQDANYTAYNALSLNGNMTDAGNTGLFGGASPADNNLYVQAVDSLVFRTNGNTIQEVMGSNGHVGFNSPPSGTYWLYVGGSVWATSVTTPSDDHLKKNVGPLVAGLKEVEQLKPVTFEWNNPKDDAMKGQHIGFIAQDVEKVLPTVIVTEHNKEQTKGMNYAEVIPVLVKAIQELKEENDNLSAKLDLQAIAFQIYKNAHP
jgi:hypothetical protein